MSTIAEWIDDKVAPSEEALKAGDGCHKQEGQALQDYLSGKTTAHDAARAITSPVLAEDEPKEELYRLWALLAEALVELKPEREKLYELASSIQDLPPHDDISFNLLPGFGHMWSDLYFHRSNYWGISAEPLSDERKSELRQHYQDIATVEAAMYVRGIGNIPATWGFDTINLVFRKPPGALDIYIGEIHAWLSGAGETLRGDLRADEEASYSRLVHGSKSGEQKAYTQTMDKHWNDWRNALLRLGTQISGLSDKNIEIALECYRMMGD